jgi:hypothetical protein
VRHRDERMLFGKRTAIRAQRTTESNSVGRKQAVETCHWTHENPSGGSTPSQRSFVVTSGPFSPAPAGAARHVQRRSADVAVQVPVCSNPLCGSDFFGSSTTEDLSRNTVNGWRNETHVPVIAARWWRLEVKLPRCAPNRYE